MEFYPAHTSYQIVKRMGFRTFMKMNGHYHEPFSSNDNTSIMYVGNNELEVSEIDEELGIKVDVLYYVLPNEKTGTLVRQVSVTPGEYDVRNYYVKFKDQENIAVPILNEGIVKSLREGKIEEIQMDVIRKEQNNE